MRLLVAASLLAIVFGACGGRASGPAWPKMAEDEEDGGESLAPRQATSVAAVTEDEEDEEEAATPAADVDAKPAADTEAKPPAATPTMSAPIVAPEEVINLDDIVIEIDE